MAAISRSTLKFRYVIAFALPFYVLDQATKWLIVKYLGEPYEARSLTLLPDFFHLVSVANTGAAFGMFTNNNGFFIALSVFVFAMIFALCRYGVLRAHPMTLIGAGLILAGILGNVTDRVTRGHVVDFLQFDLHIPGANPFPSFNIADSCIFVAAVCFVIDSFRSTRRAETTG
jgi:signal peptidase II